MLGTLIAFSIGLGIGDIDEDRRRSFEIQYYWYIIFALPILIAIIQVMIICFAFPYDTPPILKRNGENEKLLKLMRNIYLNEEIVQERIGFIISNTENE